MRRPYGAGAHRSPCSIIPDVDVPEVDPEAARPGPGRPRRVTRWKQAGIGALGLVLAAAMVLLGVWQLDVYHSQGQDAAQSRVDDGAVALTEVAPAGSAVIDGYGRTVSFSGTYDPDLQLLVPVPKQPGTYRVLSGLKQTDGSVVPVIRGTVTSPVIPAAPTGSVNEQGVLLPTEEDQPGVFPSGQIGSVRIPGLAQTWPGPLVSGFVTLTRAESASQGLAPATLVLPEGQGRLRNAAYALQWWVFAAFALGMALRMARDVGVQDTLDATESVEEPPSTA